MQTDADLVDTLSACLQEKNGLALFACGGTIPITEEDSNGSQDTAVGENKSSCPITLRWDARDGKTPSENTKLRLPLDETTAQNLDHLLAAAEPATFGRGGEDVYDEEYRKALKLDTTKFSSTFNPYELGIIDTIAQLLLPSAIDSRTHRAVCAELYKLNVRSYQCYSDPISPTQVADTEISGVFRTFWQVQASRRHPSVTAAIRFSGCLSSRGAQRWSAQSLAQGEGYHVRLERLCERCGSRLHPLGCFLLRL